MEQFLNFIDGKEHAPLTGSYLEVYEPASGTPYALVASSDTADVELAISAARRAAPAWGNTTYLERASYLNKIADLIEGKAEEFAQLESRDTGKPITLTRTVDIPRAISNFRFFAAAITQFSTASYTDDLKHLHYTVRDPLGVVGCISPWNLPIYLLSWKIAPALAAGNCVVAKPSEVTPATAALLGKVAQQAGLPAGVFNIVHGLGGIAGSALVADSRVRAISFTGGTTTGRSIASAVAGQFKKLSLEMGGKNATIVFDDCDFERALAGAVRAGFTNQGEICLCGSRLLVQRSIYAKFVAAFAERVKALTSGDPLEASTNQGALVSEAHFQKVSSAVQEAVRAGGKIICGGAPIKLSGRCANGWFYAPTVIEQPDYSCALNQEEIFGPVVSVIPFSTDQEAIDIANSTRYGLSASLWSNTLGRAHQAARALAAGMVWVNCWLVRDLRTPFGGVKESGLGREGGFEALKFFTEEKSICVSISPQ